MKRRRSSSKGTATDEEEAKGAEDTGAAVEAKTKTKTKAKSTPTPTKKKTEKAQDKKEDAASGKDKKKKETKKKADTKKKATKKSPAKKPPAKRRRRSSSSAAKKSEPGAEPTVEWETLSWSHSNALPVARLIAHCRAADKKGEGYVSTQQFKRILSATLPMAEFSGKKELDSIVSAAESLIRRGYVPYTLFEATSPEFKSYTSATDDKVDAFIKQLKSGLKSATESLVAITEDEHMMEKLKSKNPLHLLAKDFSAEIATALLSAGVDIDAKCGAETAFLVACKKKNLKAARFFLDHGANINAETRPGVTALFTACSTGDLEVVKFLLEYRKPDSDAMEDKPLVEVNTCTELGTVNYKGTHYGRESPLMIALNGCPKLSFATVRNLYAEASKKKAEMKTETNAATDEYEHLAGPAETIVSLLLPHIQDINQSTGERETPIASAVKTGNPYLVKKILQAFPDKVDTNVVLHDTKQPLLHVAISLDVCVSEITALLVDAPGTKVDCIGPNGETALYLACQLNRTATALVLLRAGANPSLAPKQHYPLHQAAHHHNAYLAHHLIEAGADVNVVDQDGRNVLHLVLDGNASRHFNVAELDEAIPAHLRSSLRNCLKLFSSCGAKVEHSDVLGNTPVAYALVYGHLTTVPVLFDLATPKNSNLFDKVSYQLSLPVKPSCQESDYEEWVHGSEEKRKITNDMSEEEKANVAAIEKWKKEMIVYNRRQSTYYSFRSHVQQCALHFFAKQGKLELLREVISRLGDPREINTAAADSGGATALILASQRQDTRMMELLIKHGADVNQADKHRQRPLHAVLQASSVSDPIASVSLLCDVEGIKIDEPDSSGNTPLALAAKKGAVMSSLCLLNHGANIDAANILGNTPLVQALLESHVTYAALLMQKGATLNTPVVTTETKHRWNSAKRQMQQISKRKSSTLFDFAAQRNYEGLCFLMLDIGMEGTQLFQAFHHLLETSKYTLAQVLIKKYSANEDRRTELRKLNVHALVGLISGLEVSNDDERFKEWWQELIDRLLEIAPPKAALTSDSTSNVSLPTLLAAEANHPQILRYLIKRGLDFAVYGKNGDTLLHIAARKNLPQVITAVIGENAGIVDKAKDKMDVVDEDEEHEKEAELDTRNRKLLSKIINAKNNAQETALIRATHTHSFASYRNDQLLSKLLEIEGVDVDAQDAKNNTALFYAVKTSADKCVQVLLNHGASPAIVCEKGETAIFEAARKNSYTIMHALLTTGKVDPHVINQKGERLLALCQPLSAVALYQYVSSKKSSSSSSSSSLMALYPEFEPRKGENADDVVTQLVAFLELINEGLQLYPDQKQPLEQLRQLVAKHLTENKQQNLVPREVLQNTRKQLSFSSLSQEELLELQKKRKNMEEEREEADDQAPSSKRTKADDDETKQPDQPQQEEEEVIEEPSIEIGDDIEQIAFPPPKKWTVKLAQKFVDQEFKNRNRVDAKRVYLLWDKLNAEEDEEHSEQEKMEQDEDTEGYLYDAKLNLCDISYGTYGHNKYYIIQALGNRTRPDRFYLWTRWARVGSYSFESQCQVFDTRAEVLKAFRQKFRDKTKNNWDERAHFQQAHDRYFYIPATHEVDEDTSYNSPDGDDASTADSSCNLPGPVQSLLRLISNRKEFMYTFSAYGLRTAGLGSLSSGQIRNGFKILKIITNILTYMKKKDKKGQQVHPKFRNALVQLSNKYYSILPYNFGRRLPDVISTTDQVAEQMRILESLADIDLGVQILSEAEKEGLAGGHVLEKLYHALHTELSPMDKTADEWQVINEFMGSSGLTVLDAFTVNREGEDMRFRPFSHLHNRMLLAHGTRLANAMGILRQGLRIAPPEAPHAGYAFGKGIYFADVAEKSANYCSLGQGEIGVFFLCEVALGNQYKCYQANYIEMLPTGKHSTMGCGRVVPSPESSIYTDEGVKIPLGRTTPSEEDADKCRLGYNEHIVYNEGQVRIRYILKVRRGK